jgi:hypothetical protein
MLRSAPLGASFSLLWICYFRDEGRSLAEHPAMRDERAMMMRLLAVFLLSAAAAHAQEPPAAQPSLRPAAAQAMRFEWVREGPASACAEKCREWVAASGQITPETPRDFTAFTASRDVRGATIVLDSGGGAVLAGIALGRMFRRLAVTTMVGKTIKLPAEGGSERAMLSPRGACGSMCVFAFLGGSRRYVPAGARVLVHQIWPVTKREDAFAATYSADDMMRIQRELGLLARYTADMGADIELFEIAARIPPWEGLRPLSAADIRRMGLQNAETPFPGAASGAVATAPVEGAASATAVASADQGWAQSESAGLRGLSRKQPITVEGEQIGTFELAFACAEAPGSVMIAYVEKRRQPWPPADRLRGVLVAAGKERLVLHVESSTSDAASGELHSVARGTAPPALLGVLAETQGKSLVVATMTAANHRTQIRLGDTGFAENYARTIANCRK